MIVINDKWLVIGLVSAIFLYFLLSKTKDGFQNPRPTTGNTDVKAQVCAILNDTYNSVKFNYDNMDKTNLTNTGIMATHLENIQKQIVAQGCE
jgi:hypothetical protein